MKEQKHENNDKNNRNDEKQLIKDKEKEATKKKLIVRNKMVNNSSNIGVLFETIRGSVYFTTVLFMSVFHAISSFSNSFIIEVIVV